MNLSIEESVEYLVEKHNSRDPEEIAKGEGIEIIDKPYSPGTKGYYISVNGRKYIVVNSNLDDDLRQIVLSHELGHAIHHDKHNIYFVRENTYFSIKPYEDEANAFAAELLIDLTDIDEVAFRGMTIEEVSKCLRVTPELVEYKIKSIKD